MRRMMCGRQAWFVFIGMSIVFSMMAVGCAKKVETAKETVSPPEERVAPAAPAPPGEEAKKEERPLVKEGEVTPPEAPTPAAPAALVDVYFDFDKYAIRPDAKSILEKDAKWLQANSQAKIQIEGHCDERGTSEYNMVLGERRSRAAKQFLAAMGIDVKRLSTISYGKERPICTEHDEGCYAKNRRAHFVVVK
jgi:peptidoglycan-associated lipoprotein